MKVEYGKYDDDPELDAGTLVAEDGDAWLISDTDLEDDTVQLKAIDNSPGRVRIHQFDDVEDKIGYTDMHFEKFQTARLAFGLWEKAGPFTQPEGRAIPIEVATAGQEAIAAYLRVGDGYPNDRASVAEKMDITEQTVSNYCNRIRWTP